MPFTALKHFWKMVSLHVLTCCAPPNAVYGIETFFRGSDKYEVFGSCAPPNAVYGIETTPPKNYFFYNLFVVRRLMPFTALKLLPFGSNSFR